MSDAEAKEDVVFAEVDDGRLDAVADVQALLLAGVVLVEEGCEIVVVSHRAEALSTLGADQGTGIGSAARRSVASPARGLPAAR